MPAIRSPLRPAIRAPLRSPLVPALGGSQSLTAQVQALFAGGKVGGMWDLGDMSTLLQDDHGTVPVTSVTQPVGMVLDKSLGLVPGAEFNVDPNMTSLLNYPVEGSPSIRELTVNGLHVIGALNDGAKMSLAGTAANVTYLVEADISLISGGVKLTADYVDPNAKQPTAGAGFTTIRFYFRNKAALYMVGGGPTEFYVRRLSVKPLPGNHATQPTAGSRPLFSPLKNLLVKTEQLDDGELNVGIWKRRANVVVTPNQGSGGFSDLDRIENSVGSGIYQGLYQATEVAAANKTFTAQVTLAAVSGTTTAFLLIGAYDGGEVGNSAVVSLTTTPTTFTVSHTFGAGAVGNCFLEIAPNVVGVPILAGRAQIERGSVATRYQRVNTASDYDTVGFPAFAQFDATDDALLFPAITFGGAFNTFVAGKVTGGTQGVHLWRTADVNGTWAKYKSGDATTPTGTGSGSPTYAVNGTALSPSQQGQLYTQINGVDCVVESIGVVLTAETALQFSGFAGSLFTGNSHRILMISGTLTAAEKLLCRQWCAEGNGATVV